MGESPPQTGPEACFLSETRSRHIHNHHRCCAELSGWQDPGGTWSFTVSLHHCMLPSELQHPQSGALPSSLDSLSSIHQHGTETVILPLTVATAAEHFRGPCALCTGPQLGSRGKLGNENLVSLMPMGDTPQTKEFIGLPSRV